MPRRHRDRCPFRSHHRRRNGISCHEGGHDRRYSDRGGLRVGVSLTLGEAGLTVLTGAGFSSGLGGTYLP